MSERLVCPACGSSSLTPIYKLSGIPVQSCILLDDETSARQFPRHDLVLYFCEDCGLVFNAVFERARVAYEDTTEESQHFSGTFNGFAKQLVREIAGMRDWRGSETVEIGCGKGDFLRELVDATGLQGLGIDPGFLPDRFAGGAAQAIRFEREYFDPRHVEMRPDLIVCRHTLEHIDEVGRFMDDVAALVDERKPVTVFFETPDVARVLAEGAFWDIYYEHCSYFTMGSHARALRRAGFNVTHSRLAYDGQYIIQYAVPGESETTLEEERDMDVLRGLAAGFPAKVAEIRGYWTDFVQSRHAAGKRVAIWGGGSKGVSFLTTNDVAESVSQVVDINPHKQGKYLPVTAHQVIGPQALTEAPPDTVIVMNPIYLPEIGRSLADLGLSPELVAV
ncbi:MAG: methyltransferase domain-containing protein [Pseudomonadota bacterium]